MDKQNYVETQMRLLSMQTNIDTLDIVYATIIRKLIYSTLGMNISLTADELRSLSVLDTQLIINSVSSNDSMPDGRILVRCSMTSITQLFSCQQIIS